MSDSVKSALAFQERSASTTEELYRRYGEKPLPNTLYDAKGNRVPMDPKNESLANEWVEIFEQKNGKDEELSSSSSSPPGQVCVSCPPDNWVKLDHCTEFPDDYGQSLPAAGTPYRLTFSDGYVCEGELDEKGRAHHKNVPAGICEVEYEPTIDETVAKLKKEFKAALDEIVQQEQQEAARWQKNLDSAEVLGSNTLAKAIVYIYVFERGFGKGFTDSVMALKGVSLALVEVGKRTNVFTGPRQLRKDIKALKKKYAQLKRFADEDLETYLILILDPEIYLYLLIFVEQYIDAQHPVEIVEFAGEVTFDTLLALLTSGAGAVVILRHIGKLKKIKSLGKKLAAAMRRQRWLKKRGRGNINQTIKTTSKPTKPELAKIGPKKKSKATASGSSSGSGTTTSKAKPKKKPPPPPLPPEQQALKKLGSFKGKRRKEIQKILREQDYKMKKSGTSKIYTKDMGNGKTVAVRLDPADRRLAMNPDRADWAGAKTHAHKEVVPTSDIRDGSYFKKGYNQNRATKVNDSGLPSSNPSELHMPIETRKGK